LRERAPGAAHAFEHGSVSELATTHLYTMIARYFARKTQRTTHRPMTMSLAFKLKDPILYITLKRGQLVFQLFVGGDKRCSLGQPTFVLYSESNDVGNTMISITDDDADSQATPLSPGLTCRSGIPA
jgi:hypothetical protein